MDNTHPDNPRQMNELTAFQRDILWVLVGSETPHGIAVQNKLEAYYDRRIHHGRLYPNLDSLHEMGYLEKGKKDNRSNEYVLTDKGEELLTVRLAWEHSLMNGKLPAV